MRTRWLLIALVLSAILALSHYVASEEYLYWRFVWLDVPVHFLGGLTLGVVVVALLNARKPVSYIALMAVVILGWEVFEYIFGLPRESNYMFDTALDVLMGTLGASVAYVLARLSLWRSA